MNDGSTSQEIRRLRAALILLLIGTVFIIWAWTSWMYRSANLVATRSIVRSEAVDPASERVLVAKNLTMFLLVGLVLVLAVLFGGYALVRAGRRHRDRLLRPPPTQSDFKDIWSQHEPRPVDLDDEDISEKGV